MPSQGRSFKSIVILVVFLCIPSSFFTCILLWRSHTVSAYFRFFFPIYCVCYIRQQTSTTNFSVRYMFSFLSPLRLSLVSKMVSYLFCYVFILFWFYFTVFLSICVRTCNLSIDPFFSVFCLSISSRELVNWWHHELPLVNSNFCL